ncbi:MAG TPA: heavy metal-associated domain-containing protein [Nocardioidaceae bacterium]|nr:heavy metal-associated domain-containing protein [Nocardioidaceae bacterium]
MHDTDLRTNPTTALFQVDGMTCEHCTRAVAGEIYKIPGVLQAYADLANGTVNIASEDELRVADVEAAVTEAGYSLVVGPTDKEN